MADRASPPLPIAIVGCGAIAAAYVAALRRGSDFVVRAVVDPDGAARANVAAATGASAFADLDALLGASTPLAAALLLTPPASHERLACTLLARGLHVLCEKPLATSVPAAERMLGAARDADRLLMLGSKFRYTADVVSARALLDDGVLGDVVFYANVFCSHVAMAGRWHADPNVSGGGVLIDNGCHSVDLARFLLGPIDRVTACFGPQVQALPVEDTARLDFVSSAGTLGIIDLSWSAHQATDAYVRLCGTRGACELGWRQSRWQRAGGQWQPFGSGYDKLTAFAAQLADFAAAIRGERAPAIAAADALASAIVIDCAYRAAAARCWTEVPP